MKGGKKMKGLMCQSPSSTAVCMASETLSVIVSKSRCHDYNNKLVDHHHGGAKRMNSSKYIRLGEHPATAAPPPPPPHRRNISTTKSSDTATTMMIPSLSIPVKNGEEKQSQDAKEEDQVVVMRVSIHCQGCAGKVKKHLAKMEGVTSFNIDLESKRVIVRGHVSAVGVLDSLSKIKRAELMS